MKCITLVYNFEGEVEKDIISRKERTCLCILKMYFDGCQHIVTYEIH